MLQILSNIKTFCAKNKYMYEIKGYLIYLLIVNELCDIEDIIFLLTRMKKVKL